MPFHSRNDYLSAHASPTVLGIRSLDAVHKVENFLDRLLTVWRKRSHPSKTQPRNEPTKKHFLCQKRLPACLPVYAPREDFFSVKRQLSRLTTPSLSLMSRVQPDAQHVADESRLPVEVLPLDLVQEVEVALVEVVHTDVTVLSTGRVALASRVRRDGVLTPRVSIQASTVAVAASPQRGEPTRGPKWPRTRPTSSSKILW